MIALENDLEEEKNVSYNDLKEWGFVCNLKKYLLFVE